MTIVGLHRRPNRRPSQFIIRRPSSHSSALAFALRGDSDHFEVQLSQTFFPAPDSTGLVKLFRYCMISAHEYLYTRLPQ